MKLGESARLVVLWCAVGGLLSAQISKPSADDLLKEANVAIREENYPKAELWLRELVASYPQDSRGVLTLLNVLEAANKWPEALRVSRQFQAQYKTNPLYHVAVGRILRRTDQTQEALTEFQLGLRYANSPDSKAQVYNSIGDTQRELGNLNDAIAAFRSAKSLTGQPSLGLAMTLGERDDFAGEIREYRELLAWYPTASVVLNNLSYAYAEQGQNLNEALGYAQQAVAQEPGNSYYVDTLGWVFYKQGRLEHAETELRRATQMEDGNSSVHWEHLAAVMDARGVWTPERRELRDLLRGGSTPRKLARVKEMLGKLK